MKYRDGSEVSVRDQVVGKVGESYVAGSVIGIEGDNVRISPAICGAVAVAAKNCLPLPASAFEDRPEQENTEGTEKIVNLPPATPADPPVNGGGAEPVEAGAPNAEEKAAE